MAPLTYNTISEENYNFIESKISGYYNEGKYKYICKYVYYIYI